MSIAGTEQALTAPRVEPVPLERWLWRSYVRSAIIPLLFIELTFLAIYWVSNQIVYTQNVSTVSSVSRDYLSDIARREATSTSINLASVSQTTSLFAHQTLKALKGNHVPSAAEQSRYQKGATGGFFTTRDNGGTASFYSALTPIGPEQINKVWKLAALDPLMIDIKNANSEISSLYFNTFDSYNRIYPYFDVRDQYPRDMDIPSYNFYYDADAAHNPERRAVWTDAYIDPAGHGWMVSSIAPVWNGTKLEGVVGIDLTLKTMIDRLITLKLPWDGYAVLVDREGRILALPPKGEKDFGLKELTEHSYAEAIQADTFKPDSFNIKKRADTRALADAMAKNADGVVALNIDGPRLASFSRIAGPGWHLVIIAPTAKILADADTLKNRLRTIGLIMLAGLLVFYLVFFVFLYRRAQAMSTRVASPLGIISGLIERIGDGQYHQKFAGSHVTELDDLGRRLVLTGNQLGEAHDRIVKQERIVSRALARQKQVNEEQIRFIRVMSHELRTPLSVIDSGAQIIDRKAEIIKPQDLRDRSAKLRAAVRRIADLLQKLVSSATPETEAEVQAAAQPVELNGLVSQLAKDMIPAHRLDISLSDHNPLILESPSLAIALRAVLDNALRYSPEDTTVHVALSSDAASARLDITDNGQGIPEDELPRIGERFFRGAGTTGTEGAGVGLYVARRLVEGFGGQITIASNGEGTTVTITLPVTGQNQTGDGEQPQLQPLDTAE